MYNMVFIEILCCLQVSVFLSNLETQEIFSIFCTISWQMTKVQVTESILCIFFLFARTSESMLPESQKIHSLFSKLLCSFSCYYCVPEFWSWSLISLILCSTFSLVLLFLHIWLGRYDFLGYSFAGFYFLLFPCFGYCLYSLFGKDCLLPC